jgi:hypothetical protein
VGHGLCRSPGAGSAPTNESDIVVLERRAQALPAEETA